MQINITYDASVANAPAGFEAAVQAAVAYLESVIATPITVNIQFSYGEIAGQPMEPGSLGESEPFGIWSTYSQIKAGLTAVATSADDLASVATLPASDPTNGGDFFLNTSEAKALGLFPANYSGIDGYVGLDSSASYTFNPNDRAVPGLYDAIGILEHEITEVLGRVADVGLGQTNATNIYSALDLFRYSSSGVRDMTAAGDFFSVNGTTLLSQFNNAFQNGGDPGDWASSVTGDSFDAFTQPGVENVVSATDLRELDVLGFHSTAPTPVPPISTPTPGVAAEAPVTVSSNLNIAQGQADYFTAAPPTLSITGLTLSGTPTLTNAGTITLISSAGASSVNVGVGGSQHGGEFSNTSTGALYVETSATGAQADGFQGGLGSPSVDNAGLIQAVSAAGSATAVVTADSASPFTNESTGVVKAWAGETAIGVDLVNGGSFSNAGLIQVTGVNATGEQGASSFTNTGTIDATDVNGGWGSVGADVGTEITSLTNKGTIQADYVVYYDTSGSNGVSGNIAITNSGDMIGALALANGNDSVTNTGTITGDIYFGDGNSVYNGVGGTIGGAINLGFGTNTVTLGNEGETVIGGFGSDTITGGSGNDLIEIGRGNNTIDGGGGFNTLSFADSATGVTVNLGTGVATDAGTDSIKNIQEVIGSNYDDTLIAGAAAATLIAGSGQDTLTGGAGNDTLIAGSGGDTMTGGGGVNTFIFSQGDQQLTITDFNTGDVLKIYGYTHAEATIQEGANLVIDLSGGDSVVLDNTTSASLNSKDLIYTATAYPGQSLTASPPPFGTNPVFIEQNMKIYAGETINEIGQPYGLVNEGHSLDDFGVVNVSYPVAALTDDVYGWIDNNINPLGEPINPVGDTVTLESTSQFTVSDLEGSSVGFEPAYATSLSNAGQITITAGGDAYAVQASTASFNFTNTASGSVAVTAQGAGYGLVLPDGGQVVNNGSFQVSGVTSVYGLKMDQAQGQSFTNSALFQATGAGSQSFGIDVAGLASTVAGSQSFTINNSGTISAQTAITEYFGASEPTQLPNLAITNSGTITGTVVLDSASATLVSTGVITGNIMLADDSAIGPPSLGDTVDLSGGKSAAQVFIAPGSAGNVAVHDVIKTGASGGTIHIAGGESDLTVAITGGAGVATKVQFDIASTQASEVHNANGTWTLNAGTDGTETLTNVVTLQFTDKTVTLSPPPPPVPNDFNGDGKSDVLFQSTAGALSTWELNNTTIIGGASLGAPAAGLNLVGTGNFTGDGTSDLLFQNTATGEVTVWLVNNDQVSSTSDVGNPGPGWTEVGTGDFNGDGMSDVLFRNTSGLLADWNMNGGVAIGGAQIGNPGPNWMFKGIGDFNGDGTSDILLENTSGTYVVWLLGDNQIVGGGTIGAPGPGWTFAGIGDFNGDGKSDILFRDAAGDFTTWDMSGDQVIAGGFIGNPGPGWSLVGIGDYNGDGKSDLMFQNISGAVETWDISGTSIIGGGTIGNPGAGLGVAAGLGHPQTFPALFLESTNGTLSTWEMNGDQIVGGGTLGAPSAGFTAEVIGDFNGDGERDIAFQSSNGSVALWLTDGAHVTGGSIIGAPGAGWSLIGAGDFNGAGPSDLLFRDSAGDLTTWDLSGTTVVAGGFIGNPGANEVYEGIGDFNGDGRADILFRNTVTGDYSIWLMNDNHIIGGGDIGAPGAGWSFAGIGDLNGDGKADILFQDAAGDLTSWEMNGTQVIGGGFIGAPGPGWHFQEMIDLNGDGKADILFTDAAGDLTSWLMNGTQVIGGGFIGNPGAGWHLFG